MSINAGSYRPTKGQIRFELQNSRHLVRLKFLFLFCFFLDNSELQQQLAALSVGQKLKLTVDTVNDTGATFKSDGLIGATILANKHHVMGMY